MKIADNFSQDDKAAFVRAFSRRLLAGSEPGFNVRIWKNNVFELAVIKNAERYAVMIENEKSASLYGSYPKPVPVKEIAKVTRSIYPKFLLPPGFITARELEADYSVDMKLALSLAFDAIARRINSKGAKFEIFERRQGYPRRPISSFTCGNSFAEAALKLAV